MKNLSARILPAFMLLSSILLLYIGVPRFLAELMLVPGNPIYVRMNHGEPVTDEEVDIAQESREQAVSFVDHPKAYFELGQIYLFRARGATSEPERSEYARKALEHLDTSLKLAPVNTFAWASAATACLMLGPDYTTRAVEAWRASVALARFEPFVFLARNHIGINLYNEMTDEDHSVLREQIDLTYNWDRTRLRNYARDNNLVPWVAFLLHDQPEKAAWIKE